MESEEASYCYSDICCHMANQGIMGNSGFQKGPDVKIILGEQSPQRLTASRLRSSTTSISPEYEL